MILPILLILILIYCSLKSIKYLLLYFRLNSSGIKCPGEVDRFEFSNYLISRNINIPVFNFKTDEGKIIIGRPVYSLFMELNNYQFLKSYVIIYDAKSPTIFVIKSRMEVILTAAFILVLILTVFWLIMYGIIGVDKNSFLPVL